MTTYTVTKEHPIIFSGEMVRAILDDRKTQTRRIIKPSKRDADGICIIDNKHAYNLYEDGITDGDGMEWPIGCPYGLVGDRLWVRETWRVGAWDDDPGRIAVDYRADNHARKEWLLVPDVEQFNRLLGSTFRELAAKGTAIAGDGAYRWKAGESPCQWRSPYHMPRWASRIILEVTEVRLQEVQDISEEDAQAEGCEPKRIRVQDLAAAVYGGPRWINAMSYMRGFGDLWDSLNAKRGYALDTNPWVRAITFKRI